MSGEQPPTAGRAILQALIDMEARIMARLDKIGSTPAAGAPAVASDADLDGQYGNPEVKKDPPRWKGTSEAPRRMSECSVAFLDELASFHDWRAGKSDEKAAEHDKFEGEEDERDKERKYARYARTDAARARGWAARLRAGWKPPESGDGW